VRYDEAQNIRQCALDLLEEGPELRAPREFIEEVRKAAGATEREALDALWYYIDRGKVTLTPDRRLEVVQVSQPVA
jgi:hypothetical protein